MMAAANSIASTGIVLEPLRKGNYENWSTLVRNYLVGQGLWEGIVELGPPKIGGSENEDERTSRSAKALHAIQLACGSVALSSIRTSENANEAWSHLHSSFSEVLETVSESEAEYEAEAESESESADSKWITELHSFVEKGKWNAAKGYIRKHGYAATSSTRPPLGRTILHVAVAAGRERIVGELLSTGYHNQDEIQQLLRKQDKRGYTALALAAELTDNKEVAEWMIEKGGEDLLSIRTKDKGIKTKDKGEIPILLAAAKGHKRMTRYLFSQIHNTNDEFVSSDDGRVLFGRCISAEIFDVAASLLRGREPLGNPKDANEKLAKDANEELAKVACMALADMPSAFRSGAQLGWWNRFIYDSLRLKMHSTDIVPHHEPAGEEHSTKILPHHEPADEEHGAEIVPHHEPADEEAGTNTLANHRTTRRLGRIFRSMVSALLPVKPSCRRFGQFTTSVLRVLPGGVKIYERKLNHYSVLAVLEWLSKVISKCDENSRMWPAYYNAMLLAAKHGIIELMDSLGLANPSLLTWGMNNNKKSILAHAICHRQEKVFQLILGIQRRQKEILISHIDLNGNNVLHLAAELGPSSYLNRMSNPALQMQKELQWFNAVKRIVPPKYKEAKNIDGMNPHELFAKEHEDLMKAGEQWARDAAGSFTLVGTLIVTIMFAAAFTVPGGNEQNTGIPIFLKRRTFLVFIIADTISLVMSSSSVLIFIEILTLRYAMKDFLKSLHKILWGLITLFFSVTSMMVTFVAALSLMLKEYPRAIVAASSLVVIPVLVLIHTLLSLSYEILKSTTWTPENS